VVFHLLDEAIPALADPFPPGDPLPGMFRLHLPADGITIWYTVTPYLDTEVITIQALRTDT
jgi:hypothetical protein